MKKTSTTGAIGNKNLVGKLTIGLDLGDRSSWYCVLDEAGEVVGEQKLSTTAKAMREGFSLIAASRVALETGTHSPWVSRLLSELGHEVIVAHARNVRLIGESRKKDDRLDARTLARLARIDPQLLAPVKHRSRQAQADLVQDRLPGSHTTTAWVGHRTATLVTRSSLKVTRNSSLGCDKGRTAQLPFHSSPKSSVNVQAKSDAFDASRVKRAAPRM